MQKLTRNNLPSWWKEINADEHYLVLSNDADSLLSCNYLQEKFKGLEIGAFFNFELLAENKEITEGRTGIYVDIDTCKGMCFGNHPTIVNNPMAINLNKGIHESNYHEKYAGSVYMMLLSLYEEDLSKYNDEQLRFMLSIDSAQKGFYIPKFKRHWNNWFIDVMQLKELKHLVRDYSEVAFNKIKLKYYANQEITLDDDFKLCTDIDIEGINEDLGFNVNLPYTEFNHVSMRFENQKTRYDSLKARIEEGTMSNIFSNARTYEYVVKYSKVMTERDLQRDKYQKLFQK